MADDAGEQVGEQHLGLGIGQHMRTGIVNAGKTKEPGSRQVLGLQLEDG